MGRGPTNDGERFFVSADFKCLRRGVWGLRCPLMIMKDSLFLLISNVLGKECSALGVGPVMMMTKFCFF